MVDLRNLQEGNLSCPNAHFTTETLVERLLQPYPLHHTSKHQQLLIAMQPDLPAMFGSMESFLKGTSPLIRNASKYSAKGTQILLAFHLEEHQRAFEHTSRSSTASMSSPLSSCTRSESAPLSPAWPREWSGSDPDGSGLNPAVALSRPRASRDPTLELTTAPSTNTTAFLRCSVLDRGSGILPSMISKMAAGSFQLDMSSTRHTEAGIGFGLSIAKLVAEQVGGQLSVRSRSASFVLSSTSSPHSPAPSAEDDDDGLTATSLHLHFTCASCQSSCVSSHICRYCEEEFAQSATTCFSFSMPVSIAVPTVRAEVELDATKPFIDHLEQRTMVSAPAFQSHVVLEVLSAKAETIKQRAAMKILLVEDSLINVKVLGACLKKRGFTNLTVAHNGQEACDIVQLRLLAETAKTECAHCAFPFSVVLMDCEMPIMNGFVCTTRLKAMPNCCPIFALTADATNEVREQCATAGMDLFFTKPLQANDLIFAFGFISPFQHYFMQYSPHVLTRTQSSPS